ncbi:MAG TPA: squalene synthase HpnC [Vicinamibacterales bacterium]
MALGSERLARAYEACTALARSHYENFPVASLLLPAPMRPHVAAVYAFARIADDIADEGNAPAADRLVRLGRWQQGLHAAVANGSQDAPASSDDGHDLILIAVAESIRAKKLPLALFDDLVSAFGQDTTTTRYDSWEHVFDYCRRSANPVGRLVLRIAGYTVDELDRSSDAFCTALQLTNFWQDFGRDYAAGRVYVPREVSHRFGATEDALRSGDVGQPWVHAMSECIRVTRELFERGRRVCDGVAGRLRFELRLTWHGGMRILERVSTRNDRFMLERPALGAGDVPTLIARTIRWQALS